MMKSMNCPHCNTLIDEHEASRCLDAWVANIIFKRRVWIDDDDMWMENFPVISGLEVYELNNYSTSIAAAKEALDKTGVAVIFAPHSSVRDGCYANRKDLWLVEIIPHGGTTENAVWSYGETEEIARCRAAIKAVSDAF